MMTLGVVALAAAWLLTLAVLALDVTGIWRRGAYFRWQGTGMLLMIGVVLTSAFAEFRGWPAGRLHVLRMATFPLMLPGFALLLIAIFVHDRARHDRAMPGRVSNQLSNDERQQRRTATDDAGH
jgi:hypothetical protein